MFTCRKTAKQFNTKEELNQWTANGCKEVKKEAPKKRKPRAEIETDKKADE